MRRLGAQFEKFYFRGKNSLEVFLGRWADNLDYDGVTLQSVLFLTKFFFPFFIDPFEY